MKHLRRQRLPTDLGWYYAAGEDWRGPVSAEAIGRMLAEGQLTPDSYLWRPGMPQASAAQSLADFRAACGLPSELSPPLRPGEQRRRRNAKQNCIAIFAFCVAVPVILAVAVVSAGHVQEVLTGVAVAGGVVGTWAICLYAAIYVPLRWRTVAALPKTHRALGLIGLAGVYAAAVVGTAVFVLSRMGLLGQN